MKSKFLRILALILVMSSLISMFAIFATAEETGSTESEAEEVDETFKLLYHRTFDEGWDAFNGVSKVINNTSDQATSFDIDYEVDALEGTYNYFWSIELNGGNLNDYLQFNLGANQNVGTVIEFDVMCDDECSFANVIHMATKREGSSTNFTSMNVMRVDGNDVYLMSSGAESGGSTKPAFQLSEKWTRVRMVFDYTYEHPGASDEDLDKYFLLYVYIGSPDDSDLTLWTGEPLVICGDGGKGIQYIRFQSSAADKDNEGRICFDNVKIYDGVNNVVNITKDMGYGTMIQSSYPVTVDILGGSNLMESSKDLYSALSMKVGVDYCYTNKTRMPIATAEDETVYGAPVKQDGEILISLNKVLNYAGLPSYVHPDGNYVDVAIDFGATYIIVGKDTATVGGESIRLNAAPCYVTVKKDVLENGSTVEKSYSYIAIALSDVEKLFPGFYGDYDDMGYITVSKYENILDRSENLNYMIAVMKEFVFDYFTGDEIYEDVESYSGFDHPYILATGDDLDRLYNEYQTLNAKKNAGELEYGTEEYWKWNHYQKIVDTGNSYYAFYAAKDANGGYDTYAGLEPDPKDPNTGENLRGTRSLEPEYTTTSGYDPDGGRSNISSRTAYLEGMTYAYVLTKDVKYLKLCYEIALVLGDWTHWGPGHFLNCADASNDFAIYYDWTYDGYVELAKTEKRVDADGNESEYDVLVLAEILARQGVHEGYYSTVNKQSEHVSPIVGTGGGYYSERTNNWAAVCVGGMTVAALAILGELDDVDERMATTTKATNYLYEAKYILSENFKSLTALGLDIYAPDGSYIEGPGYWSYGTNNFFRMCAALDTATGGNYGLMDCWGMDTTCYYALYTEDNNSKYFPFHDGSIGSQDTSYFFYVADYYNDATLYNSRLNQINTGMKTATLLDMIYYPSGTISADDIQIDYYSEGIDFFSTRSSWEKDALYAAMIGGANKVSHGQIDAGTFVYHNGGNVWIYDIGTENYNCPGFWPDSTRYRYYRMKPEGNNTIAITSDVTNVPYGQRLDAVASAVSWDSNEYGSYVVYDMGTALGENNKWQRGMLLTNDRKTTVIQDQVIFSKVQTAYWFAHYSTKYVDKVQISSDGRTAYLKEYLGKDANGKECYQTLRLTIVSDYEHLKFTLMDTYTFVHTTGEEATYTPEKVASLGTVAENSRKDFRKLAIASGEINRFDLAVVIELIDDDTIGKNTELEVGYEYTSMSNWVPSADTRGQDIDVGDTVQRRGNPNIEGHLVQGMSKIEAMDAAGGLYTHRLAEFYRALTDAHYTNRMIGSADMPAEYTSYVETLVRYRDAFNKYRDAVLNLQKNQLEFVYKLMSLH